MQATFRNLNSLKAFAVEQPVHVINKCGIKNPSWFCHQVVPVHSLGQGLQSKCDHPSNLTQFIVKWIKSVLWMSLWLLAL